MDKQIRVALIHNGTPASEAYCNTLNEQLTDEAIVVNVQDPRPIRLALPVRAVPNVAIIYFADTLEEGQAAVEVLRQLDHFKRQNEIEAVVDELITAADPIADELADRVVNVFYGGGAT